jgi:hypothetical protein
MKQLKELAQVIRELQWGDDEPVILPLLPFKKLRMRVCYDIAKAILAWQKKEEQKEGE